MYIHFTPDALRQFASRMEVAPNLFREVAASMEQNGVETLKLQVKTIVYRHIDPLTEWAEEVTFFANKAIQKEVKKRGGTATGLVPSLQDQENAATDAAADEFLAAQKSPAKKPIPRKKGKK